MSYETGSQAARQLSPEARLTGMIEVHSEKVTDIDATLDEAIKVVTRAAEHHRMGILVTRISSGSYVVRVHPHVPVGLVRHR